MLFSFTFRSVRLFSAGLLLAWGPALYADLVDRVEIAIGHQAITQSQIEEELRVTALLNHERPRMDSSARRDAADRLVEQFLLTRETDVSHFPPPDEKETAAYFAKVEKEFNGAPALDRSLAAYGLTRDVLERHLALQLRTLQFTRFRFPSDETLNLWLEEARKRFNIVYLNKALH